MRPRAAIPGSLRPLLLQRRPPLGRRSRGIGRDVVLLAQPRLDAAYAVDDPQTAPKGFSVEQHFDAAGQMLGRLANDRLIAATA